MRGLGASLADELSIEGTEQGMDILKARAARQLLIPQLRHTTPGTTAPQEYVGRRR